MRGIHISDITYARCKEVITNDTIIVLPIGGGSKEHGDHLPKWCHYLRPLDTFFQGL
ncbi:hypothetical protein [Wukongibacter sp. M2B1]|uniref:hypothetical protein n=1 Tax=Wukongibacter sp. M2B1 TaxID=3088895 RepID=UPI003D7BF352